MRTTKGIDAKGGNTQYGRTDTTMAESRRDRTFGIWAMNKEEHVGRSFGELKLMPF